MFNEKQIQFFLMLRKIEFIYCYYLFYIYLITTLLKITQNKNGI